MLTIFIEPKGKSKGELWKLLNVKIKEENDKTKISNSYDFSIEENKIKKIPVLIIRECKDLP